jgi:transposase
VDLYLEVRRAHFDEGRSKRSIARDFGLARGTVDKMCAYSVPPGYRRSREVRRPKLDGFTDKIDQWLLEDLERPKKQRHTAKRLFERLRDEEGFCGGYTTVKDYVRSQRQKAREMFIPLAHPPGHGQADFGEAVVVLDGVKRKVHFFAFDLPHSDACYIRAYHSATSEAWMDGHVHAFAFFGAVPLSVVYDNDSCLVAKIEADGRRRRTQMFTEMLSHYLFDDRYGRPGKGNDKGNVEGLVGWARRNMMVPLPEFPDLASFNTWLEEQCRKRQLAILHGHKETIARRLQHDLAAMSSLPAAPYEACGKACARVSSQSLVRYKTNDYSVPSTYGFREVTIRGFVDMVEIGCGGEIIARHARCYEREQMVFNPVHYFALLEKKPGALDQAAPLADWEMPQELQTLRRLMEARHARQGRREFIQVLRLLESFELTILCAAVRVALQKRAIAFDAIKHLVLCQVERRPARLDLSVYPYLPKAAVETTKASNYMALLSAAAS